MTAHAAGAADERRARARARIAVLGEREREVAVAVGRGLSNAEIAAALFMSVATVKTHVSRVLAELDLDNRSRSPCRRTTRDCWRTTTDRDRPVGAGTRGRPRPLER
ncbi:DNA-binding NarL/FixJ family response regulator [Streptomyces phaeoluteigriseus]